MVIEFWFEFASTYSYPAAARIEQTAREQGIEVAWRPFLLGPIFKAQGWADSPFNVYPAKGDYMWRDLERICGQLSLDYNKPSTFPRSGLLASRIVCAHSQEPWLPDFVRAIYRANFALDVDISSAEVVGECLRDLGVNARQALDAANSDAAKASLREQMARAAELGIFGAPSFISAGELFWGNDRLDDALAWCRAAR